MMGWMTSPRYVAHALPVLGLVAGSLALSTGPAAGGPGVAGGADPGSPRPEVVALRTAPGSVLREAARPVTPGRSELRASYSMVAVTWPDGDVRARIRAHGAHGWGRWLRLAPLTDGGEPSAVHGTELLWVGPSDRLRLRVTGSAADRAHVVLIDPGATPADVAPADVRRVAAKPRHRAPEPPLRSRHRWGANEKWRSTGPRYNRTIQQVHIHHTATGNDYRRRDVAGILRGIYRYHTHTLRWSDIGYNFLVDRFGRAWVGRAGGQSRPVRGAHTLGFNNTSTGISVIGNFEEREPSKAVLTTLVHLAAWKLDRYHRRPDGTALVTSHGSDLYPAGERVRLPVVDGHRDTNSTACPGQLLYDLLPKIRSRTAARVARFD
jgi:uncharacterized protein with LGFP repeats